MSDQDRGPYTPQSDAPLAFDPRQSRGGGGGGGPAPMTLLVSAIILMALIVGILLFYRHGVRHPEQPATLVGAPVAETKSAPPSGDATSGDQAASLQVYKSEATPSSEGHSAAAPAFESGQEQPAPLPAARPVQPPPSIVNAPLRRADTIPPPPARPHPPRKPVIAAQLPPVPQPPAVQTTSPDSGNVAGSAFGPHAAAPSHAAPAPAPSPAHASTPPAKPASSTKPAAVATTATPKTEAKPDSAAKPKPKPTTTAEAKPAAEPKSATAAASGPVTVQIGAFSSADLAKQGWSDTAHILPSAMAGKSRKVETTVKDGKTFYRSYVGGFASKADAEVFCTSLRARSRPCMVK